MTFIEEMDRLIYEIKQDIKAVEKYIDQIENDNIYWDTWTVEDILRELESNIDKLWTLTDLNY